MPTSADKMFFALVFKIYLVNPQPNLQIKLI